MITLTVQTMITEKAQFPTMSGTEEIEYGRMLVKLSALGLPFIAIDSSNMREKNTKASS